MQPIPKQPISNAPCSRNEKVRRCKVNGGGSTTGFSGLGYTYQLPPIQDSMETTHSNPLTTTVGRG